MIHLPDKCTDVYFCKQLFLMKIHMCKSHRKNSLMTDMILYAFWQPVVILPLQVTVVDKTLQNTAGSLAMMKCIKWKHNIKSKNRLSPCIHMSVFYIVMCTFRIPFSYIISSKFIHIAQITVYKNRICVFFFPFFLFYFLSEM